MKHFIILTLFALATVSAQADQTYQCKTHLPRGEALLKVQPDNNGASVILFKFHNDSINETFSGVFTVRQGNTRISAKGIFNPKSDNIPATINGEFKDGTFFGVIYASWDLRIEFGYGNPFKCSLIRE